jgi:hypothetical protein
MHVTIDRKAPKEYAHHIRPVSSYMIGDDISVAFDEEIDCSLPLGVAVTGKGTGVSLQQSDFLVSCTGNSLFLDFAPTMGPSVSHVLLCRGGIKTHILLRLIKANMIIYIL